MSAAAEEQEENHWPGFVDALSTIVMVVTFLLIILAVAIFVLSLNIAKVEGSNSAEDNRRAMPEMELITVADNPTTLDLSAPAGAQIRSDNALVLQFSGTTLTIDEATQGAVGVFLEKHQDALQDSPLAVVAYFDPVVGGYAKNQRMSYYRVMAVRNELMNQGFDRQMINVFVREAPNATQIDSVEVVRR